MKEVRSVRPSSKVGGYVLLVTGFLACPCHLVFTLPLVLALLGGTALGSFLAENTALVTGLLAAYFIGALLLGFALLSARRYATSEECAACPPTGGGIDKSREPANL